MPRRLHSCLGLFSLIPKQTCATIALPHECIRILEKGRSIYYQKVTELKMDKDTVKILATTAETIIDRIATLESTIPIQLDARYQRHGRKRTDKVQGIAINRKKAQAELALLALQLATAALDDSTAITHLVDQVNEAHRTLVTMKQLGLGWLDLRYVKRPRIVLIKDEATGRMETQLEYRAFGPYCYYRWVEGQRQRSLYLGKEGDHPSWRARLTAIGVDLDQLLPPEPASQPTQTTQDSERSFDREGQE